MPKQPRNIIRQGIASIYRTAWGWHAYIPRTHGNGRMRKGFKRLDDAQEWVRANTPLAALENVKPLTASETIQFREASALLPPGTSLVDAARAYAATLAAASIPDLPTSEAASRFLSRKQEEGCRPSTLHYYRGVLARLADIPLAAQGSQQISAVLSGLAPRRRNNVLAALNTFFRWAVAEKLSPSNPAANLEPTKQDWHPPRIYTPMQVAALFAETRARRPDFIPYLTLAAFAGLRTSSIFRLRGSAIDLRERTVTVGGYADKLRRGYISSLTDTAAAWLSEYPFPDRPCTDECWWCGMQHVWAHLSFKRIPNALRHSFASYHYALHGDAHATASALGHLGETETLIANYRRLVSKTDAALYFSILPSAPVLSARNA